MPQTKICCNLYVILFRRLSLPCLSTFSYQEPLLFITVYKFSLVFMFWKRFLPFYFFLFIVIIISSVTLRCKRNRMFQSWRLPLETLVPRCERFAFLIGKPTFNVYLLGKWSFLQSTWFISERGLCFYFYNGQFAYLINLAVFQNSDPWLEVNILLQLLYSFLKILVFSRTSGFDKCVIVQAVFI